MFIKADLYWLPGFPLSVGQQQVEWMPIGCQDARLPASITLGPLDLHRAKYAWTKLVHRFPRALPRLVADRAAWTNGVPRIIEWLSAAMHEGRPLPQNLFDAIDLYPVRARRQIKSLGWKSAELQHLLNVLSWTMILIPRELPKALSWLEENLAAVETILRHNPAPGGIVLALLLERVNRLDGRHRAGPLLALLGDHRAYELAIEDVDPYLAKMAITMARLGGTRKGSELPAQPDPALVGPLQELLAWLVCQDHVNRRRTLEHFRLFVIDDLLTLWERWWAEASPVIKVAHSLAEAERGRKTAKRAKKVARRLRKLKQQLPPQYRIQTMVRQLQEISAPQYREFNDQFMRTARLLPMTLDGLPMRPVFLSNWLASAKRHFNTLAHVTRLLAEFRAFLLGYGHVEGILEPWREELTRGPWPWWLGERILDEIKEEQRWPVFFEAVGLLCSANERKLSADDLHCLVTLGCLTSDSGEIRRYFLSLADAGMRREWDLLDDIQLLREVHGLSRGGGDFGRLAAILAKVYWKDMSIGGALSASTVQLDEAGWLGSACELVLDGELQAVITAGRLVRVLEALDTGVPQPAPSVVGRDPDWSERYPAEFRSILALLDSVSPKAVRAADKILGKDFPSQDRLREEVASITAVLAERPEDERLMLRLQNLKARLETGKSVTPVRRDRLLRKLERTTRRAMLRDWNERLKSQLGRDLARYLGVSELPEGLYDQEQLAVLERLFSLPANFRELGIRLLRRRCGPPPWNLADAQENQAFLDQLRQEGIDTDPWLHPPEPQNYQAHDGRSVHLSFELDPLEIFLMGWHFNTCLSPGEYNFFSVIANAADVNKHVIYARDKKNRVIGRCLLALTAQGGLLTFHPYSHDPSLQLGEIIGELADNLAMRMGSAVVPSGRVPALVAPEWYDDGPRDLTGRFAFLRRGSEFRRSLKRREPATLIPALEELFEPLQLNALTLPLVVALPELARRPELIIPLLPFAESSSQLPDHTWLKIAQLAHMAGAEEVARRALRGRGETYVRALLRQDAYTVDLDNAVLYLFAELEPSMAIRLVRQSRPKGVRRDEDETLPKRLMVLARAHETLHRPFRAERLRARASKRLLAIRV